MLALGDLLGNNQRFNLDGTAPYTDRVKYTEVLSDNQVYETMQVPCFRYSRKLSGYDEKNLAEVSKNFTILDSVGKAPFSFYQHILNFYNYIYEKDNTEATATIFYNYNNVEISSEIQEEFGNAILQEGNFFLIIPPQRNSGANTDIAETVGGSKSWNKMSKWFEENMWCFMETHSHHTMGAFWSGTDDANEQHHFFRVCSVFGKITSTQDVLTRLYYQDHYINLTADMLFDLPVERKVVMFNDQIIKEYPAEPYKGAISIDTTKPLYDDWYKQVIEVPTEVWGGIHYPYTNYKKGKQHKNKMGKGGKGGNFGKFGKFGNTSKSVWNKTVGHFTTDDWTAQEELANLTYEGAESVSDSGLYLGHPLDFKTSPFSTIPISEDILSVAMEIADTLYNVEHYEVTPLKNFLAQHTELFISNKTVLEVVISIMKQASTNNLVGEDSNFIEDFIEQSFMDYFTDTELEVLKKMHLQPSSLNHTPALKLITELKDVQEAIEDWLAGEHTTNV